MAMKAKIASLSIISTTIFSQTQIDLNSSNRILIDPSSSSSHILIRKYSPIKIHKYKRKIPITLINFKTIILCVVCPWFSLKVLLSEGSRQVFSFQHFLINHLLIILSVCISLFSFAHIGHGEWPW